MGDQSLENKLSENPWFKSLKPIHFQKLVEIAVEKSWPKGAIIFREGDQNDYLYLIEDGRIALEIYVPSQGRVTILTLGSNDLFGWSAVTPVAGTRTASARAIQPAQAIGFDSQALREACDADHELGYQVYRRMNNVVAGRLSATRLQLLDMYAQTKG